MSEGLDYFANVDKVDLLVGSVNVGLGSADTKSHDLGLRVFLLKLLEEGDGATFSKGTDSEAVEVLVRGLIEATLEPLLELALLPAGACMTTLEGDLGIVGNVFAEFFDHKLVGVVSIKHWRETHAASDSGLRSQDVTSNGNRRETISASDGQVGPPNLVKVELLNIFLMNALNAIVKGVFVPDLVAILLSDELSFFALVVRDLNLEVRMNFASSGIVKTV